MALQSKNRVNVNFSMSGMTDIVFLLLIFFMLTSTLLAPNALKLLFPQKGQNIVTSQRIPEVRLTADGNIFLDNNKVAFENLEILLAARLEGQADPSITLITDRKASVKESVKIMNIAANREYKIVLKENQ
jgi:biopolymer transport protein ExbD